MKHVAQAVFAALQRVAQERSIPADRIVAHHTLVEDIGFKSLDLARIVAIIEIELDADPFANLVPVTSIRTVDDLCKAYEKCFLPAEQTPAADDSPAPSSPRGASSREHQRDLRKRARDKAE